MVDGELNLEELDNATAGKNFVSEEEQAEIYRNFSKERAEQIISLKNQKIVAEQVASSYAVDQEQNSTDGKRNSM